VPTYQSKGKFIESWPPTGRNQGGEAPLENFSPPLEKCVGHNLKILDIVQKIWAPLGKLFAPPGVPSWLRAWAPITCIAFINLRQSVIQSPACLTSQEKYSWIGLTSGVIRGLSQGETQLMGPHWRILRKKPGNW